MLLLLFALTLPVEREGVVKGSTVGNVVVLATTPFHREALRRAEGKTLRCEVRGFVLSRVFEITSRNTVDFTMSEGVRPAPKAAASEFWAGPVSIWRLLFGRRKR